MKDCERNFLLEYAKMPNSKRAKQFMPFKAVTGLEIALANKEREIEEKYADDNDCNSNNHNHFIEDGDY